MAFSIITAKDSNNGIGINNELPWHIPNDLKWFKKHTKGKTVIMGSNTYFSLPKKFRPLPHRENLVLTNNLEKKEQIEQEGGIVFNSKEQIIEHCNDDTIEYMIIGGSNIYNQFIDVVDKVYITQIDDIFNCDTFFPKMDNNWKLEYISKHETINGYEYNFNIFGKV